jgi:multidrug efflux system membrane fusion protein
MSTAQIDPRVVKTIPQPVGSSPDAGSPPRPAAAPARGRWWIYPLLAVVVIGFGFLVYHLVSSAKSSTAEQSQKAKAAHDLPVVIATTRIGDLPQYLVGLGTVTPLNTATVKSRVDGAITQIAFTEGQIVHEGDFLLQIDPRPYEAALKQAQGQLAKDTAAKESADWNVQQDKLAGNGISQQQMHNDTAAAAQAEGAIEVDQAAIDTANLNLTYAHITAPITGRIGLRMVDIGNIVHASDTTGLAVITQLQPITVIFTLPEDNIAQIQRQLSKGQPMAVDAYDRDLTEKLATGTVLAVDNQIDPTTGTVRIKAQFDNADGALFPSQFVNARLLVNTIHDAVLVPSAGIQHSPSSTFAYVLTPAPPEANDTAAAPSPTTRSAGKDARPPGIHGTVSMRQVVVGRTQAAIGSDGVDTTEVISGLQPGDIVVTDGVDKLQDGSKVIGRPMAMPARTATTGPTTQASARRHRKPVAE